MARPFLVVLQSENDTEEKNVSAPVTKDGASFCDRVVSNVVPIHSRSGQTKELALSLGRKPGLKPIRLRRHDVGVDRPNCRAAQRRSLQGHVARRGGRPGDNDPTVGHAHLNVIRGGNTSGLTGETDDKPEH